MDGNSVDGGPGGDDEPSVHTYSLDEDELPSEAVVRVVSAVTNRNPVTMEPLYDSVTPDALDALFAPTTGGERRRTVKFVFTYADCEVRVRSGSVTVRERGLDDRDGLEG